MPIYTSPIPNLVSPIRNPKKTPRAGRTRPSPSGYVRRRPLALSRRATWQAPPPPRHRPGEPAGGPPGPAPARSPPARLFPDPAAADHLRLAAPPWAPSPPGAASSFRPPRRTASPRLRRPVSTASARAFPPPNAAPANSGRRAPSPATPHFAPVNSASPANLVVRAPDLDLRSVSG